MFIAKLHWLQNKNNRHLPEKHQPTQRNGDSVTIIDDIEVPDAAAEAFAKGPKYAIGPKITTEDLQETTRIEIAALAYALDGGMRTHQLLA